MQRRSHPHKHCLTHKSTGRMNPGCASLSRNACIVVSNAVGGSEKPRGARPVPTRWLRKESVGLEMWEPVYQSHLVRNASCRPSPSMSPNDSACGSAPLPVGNLQHVCRRKPVSRCPECRHREVQLTTTTHLRPAHTPAPRLCRRFCTTAPLAETKTRHVRRPGLQHRRQSNLSSPPPV